MDLNPLFVNREIGQAGIDPAACVVVVNAVPFDMHSLVSVAAENAICLVLAGVVQGSGGDL